MRTDESRPYGRYIPPADDSPPGGTAAKRDGRWLIAAYANAPLR